MKDFDQFLKNVNIPEFANYENCRKLEERLKSEIRTIEERKSNAVKFRPVLQYSLSAAVILGIIVFSLIIILQGQNKLNLNVISMTGNVIFLQNGKELKNRASYKISKGFSIMTGTGSNLEVKVGSGYNIKISDGTVMDFLEAEVKKINENCRIYMTAGSAEYSIKLPHNSSLFQVQTNISEYTVKGTKFTVKVNKDESYELKVKEGKVTVRCRFSNYEFEKIKEIDSGIYETVSKIINDTVMFEADEALIIYKKDFDRINGLLNEHVIGKIPAMEISETERKKIMEIISVIISEKDKMLSSPVEKIIFERKTDVGKHKIKKTSLALNVPLDETNVSIRSDDRFIYIASDHDNTVYCIDPKKEELIWKFNDKKLKSLSTPVAVYKNNLIFSSSDEIYVLNKQGKIKTVKKIENGPVFWTECTYGYENLYIPTSQSVYKYNGQEITQLGNLKESEGLLYISFYNGFLYYNDLLKKSIKRINPEYGTVNEDILELNDMAYMPPYASEKYIVIIDSMGTAYRLNSSKLAEPPIKLEIKSGVMSNIIIKNNNLFFITDQGKFYGINVESFKSAEFIAKIDDRINKDKYLTKKLLEHKGKIYYCGEKGNLFIYDIYKNGYEFAAVDKNIRLTGNPAVIENQMYMFDVNGNMYTFIL